MAREADPQTQLDGLARSLAEASELAPGYVFRGDERWFREQGERAVVARAKELGCEISRHDANDPDFVLSRLLDDLSAPPMFAASRCVVVQGAASLLKKAGKADAPLTHAVKAFLASSLGGTVVLDAAGVRADQAAVKAIVAAGGTVVTCRKLFDGPPPWAAGDARRAELVQWLVARARARGQRLSPDDAVLLAAAAGNDLYALDAQLEKLRYAPNGAQAVRALAGSERAVSPWAIAEDLCRGDARRAVPALEQLFRSGFTGRDGTREVDPRSLCAVLLTAVRSKVRQALAGTRALAQGGDAAQAATAAGVGTWPKARAEFDERLRSRPAAMWPGMLAEVNALERGTRENRTLDANDFVLLALRWARPQGASGGAPARQGTHRPARANAGRARGGRG